MPIPPAAAPGVLTLKSACSQRPLAHPEAIVPFLRNIGQPDLSPGQQTSGLGRGTQAGVACQFPAASCLPGHAKEGWLRVSLSIGKVQVRHGGRHTSHTGLEGRRKGGRFGTGLASRSPLLTAPSAGEQQPLPKAASTTKRREPSPWLVRRLTHRTHLEILFKHNRCFHRVWAGDLSSEKLPGEAV